MSVDLEGRKISAVIWRWRRRGAAVVVGGEGNGGAVAYRWMPARRRVCNILHDQQRGCSNGVRTHTESERERESTDSLITMP